MKIIVIPLRHLLSYRVKIALMILTVLLVLPSCGQKKLCRELDDKVILLYQQGRYSEAADVAKEELKVAEEAFGIEHHITASVLDSLASIYVRQGKYIEAEALYIRSLAIREKFLAKTILRWP